MWAGLPPYGDPSLQPAGAEVPKGGCACRIHGERDRIGSAVSAAMLTLLLAWRRRRGDSKAQR